MESALNNNEARVEGIIKHVLELSEQEAHAYIEEACKGDMYLYHQVVATYRTVKQGNENKKTHLVANRMADVEDEKNDGIIKVLFGNKRNRLLVLLSFFVLLVLAGLLTRHLVVRNILDAESDRKLLLVNNNRELVLNWIQDDLNTAQTIANVPLLRNFAMQLNDLSLEDPTYTTIIKSNLSKEATALLTRLSSFYDVSGISILSVNEPKVLLHSAFLRSNGVSEFIGFELGEKSYPDFIVARTGKLHFSPPMHASKYFYNDASTGNNDLWSHNYAPIYNFDGEVIAILCTIKSGRHYFSDVFETNRYSKSSETFAVSAEGRMLSTSRFKTILDNSSSEDSDSTLNAIQNQMLYDPGVNLMRRKKVDVSELGTGFTRIVQEMFLHVKKNDSVYSGVLTTPFNDYRGVKVIGAWAWLPEYGFGIITKQDVKEVLSATKYVDRILLASFFVIFILGYLLYNSNIRLVSFGSKLDDIKALGQYKLKDKIGEGGFGEVYRGEHSLLKKDVAIKILKKAYVGTPMLQKFRKEVEVTSSLNHPNVVNVYDYGSTDHQQFYYVMEYLNGLELSKLMGMYEVFPVNRLVYVLLQSCYALREAHSKGLIHRDINPKNIMLCNQGGACDVVKVLDFGLVKQMGSAFETGTQEGDLTGTLMFMAPERIRDPFKADYRVDIYALGAMGLYMLSGQYVLEMLMEKLSGENADEEPILDQQLLDRDDVPDELAALLFNCVQFDPDKRPESLDQLIAVFTKVLDKEPWSMKDAELWWKKYDAYA